MLKCCASFVLTVSRDIHSTERTLMTFKGVHLCSKSHDLKKNSQHVLVSFDVSAKNLRLDGDL